MTNSHENKMQQIKEINAAMQQIDPQVENAITATTLNTVIDKLIEAETPGFWSEFTDQEAEMAGAFDEAAITAEAAYAASFDNPNIE